MSIRPLPRLGVASLGAAVVLIATQQSRGKPGFLAILIPITVLEPVLIVAFHGSVTQVVQLVDGCMGLLVVGLAILALLGERSRAKTPMPMPAAASLLASPPPQVAYGQEMTFIGS